MMKEFVHKNKSGFTLIELLVVVAIIGILAAIVLSSLGSARVKARDARRDADIKTIQTALEIYYLDNGQYPNQNNWGGVAPDNGFANSGNTSWQTFEAVIGVDLPEDPVNDVPVVGADWAATPSRKLNYAYRARGIDGCPAAQAYFLVYRHEQGDVPASQSPGVTQCDGTVRNYTNNGAITVGMSPAQ